MKKKNKKRIFKRILWVTAVAILVFVVCDICITKISTQKIPHRYASAEEGRELLLANTEYYENFTQNDIDFRLKKATEHWMNYLMYPPARSRISIL